MDSCFVLIETRQHGIRENLNETSANASSDKLHNGSLYQIPCFEVTCSPDHALRHHVFQGSKEAKVVTVVSRKENVDRQNG